MDLVLTTPKTFIRVKNGLFHIKVEDKKTSLSPLKVHRLVITTRAVLTTDVLALCTKHNIDVVLIDHHGNPLGRFWQAGFGSTVTIRRKQLEISNTEKGLIYVKKWATEKINNQKEYLKKLAKNRPQQYQWIIDKSQSLENFLKELKKITMANENYKNKIMGLEGASAHIYFDLLSWLIPKAYRFEGRSRQPAKDLFNAFLNYGYGILYGQVERAMILAGLDPYIGFLHSDNYNKKALLFDLIEPYRIFVDETVFSLFSEKKVNKSMGDIHKNGVVLNAEGKKLLIQNYNQFMDKIIVFGKKKMKRITSIQAYCHQFANELLAEEAGE